MFNKKKKNKEFEFNLKLIEKIGTCEMRIIDLYERIRELETELTKHIDGGHN